MFVSQRVEAYKAAGSRRRPLIDAQARPGTFWLALMALAARAKRA